VFVSDKDVDATTLSILPGYEFHSLWGADAMPSLPADGTEPSHRMYFPPAGGFRFGFFTLPPAGTDLPADLDVAAAIAEMQDKLPGMGDHMEPDEPGMHTTDSVDYIVVLDGRIWLELDDDRTVELGRGDTVVQNGTRHAWRNLGPEPATLAVVMLGARRG
jgi:mannose-6-phosphate isomerase-like protein (cupin superfamily)